MPTHPTLRLERILLLAWTVALTMLVALKIGSIPPGLAWALLPYLALVARHLIAPIDRRTEAPSPAPAETSGPPAELPEPEAVAEPARSRTRGDRARSEAGPRASLPRPAATQGPAEGGRRARPRRLGRGRPRPVRSRGASRTDADPRSPGGDTARAARRRRALGSRLGIDGPTGRMTPAPFDSGPGGGRFRQGISPRDTDQPPGEL